MVICLQKGAKMTQMNQMTREIQGGFFDAEYRLQDITKQGDPLEKLNQHIEWEMFRPVLEEAFLAEGKDPQKGGRPPYDYVMMFKILVLQRLYNVADERTEFAIKDRLSFMRFLGLTLKDKVPDEKTIWLFRETLTQSGVIKRLFKKFNRHLDKKGLIARRGSIVDASFVEVPRQRNTRDENEDIRNGEVPEDWEDNTDKLRQKDMDARWTKKHGQSRNDERQNENTGKSGAENCLLLLFFELKRKFVQETWFLERCPIVNNMAATQLSI